MTEAAVTERDREMMRIFTSDEPETLGFEFGFPFNAYDEAIHSRNVLSSELPKLLALARSEGWAAGRREAIEECAQWISMECDLKTEDALMMADEMRRALADSP